MQRRSFVKRGRGVARSMRKAPNVAYTAVADVYQPNAEQARQWAGPDAKSFSASTPPPSPLNPPHARRARW